MVKLFITNLKNTIKSELSYKVSFILAFISYIFIFFSYYFIILALFSKFNNIRGFSLYEVMLCFGIIQFGFSFNETFFRGIDTFEDYIISGSLDRFLLRPRGVLEQVMVSKMDIGRTSKIIQSLFIVGLSLVKINISWDIYKVIVLILMMISSIVIFFSIFLLTDSYCFVTVQNLEIKNIFTNGGKHVAQYPIGIYKRGFVIFFTYIIPFGFVNYYPLLYLTSKSDNLFYAFSPLIVFLYLIPAIFLFKLGLKHYSSVGS